MNDHEHEIASHTCDELAECQSAKAELLAENKRLRSFCEEFVWFENGPPSRRFEGSIRDFGVDAAVEYFHGSVRGQPAHDRRVSEMEASLLESLGPPRVALRDNQRGRDGS